MLLKVSQAIAPDGQHSLLSSSRPRLIRYRKHLDTILSRRGPFTDPDFVPGDRVIESLEAARIL
jgi:hypothetical protein